MEITALIKFGTLLIVILGVLIFIFFYSSKKKKVKSKKKQVQKSATPEVIKSDLNYLRSEIRKQKTTTKELKVLLDLVLKHHGVIHKKLGLRPHPDFDAYSEIMIVLCRHAHTNKNLILNFDRELRRLNPEYAKEINEALTKGLNSRGA
jgi:hypothetical protein